MQDSVGGINLLIRFMFPLRGLFIYMEKGFLNNLSPYINVIICLVSMETRI